MKRWQDSSNIVLVFYTGYAGGKFITNNLGFNDKCCPAINIDFFKSKNQNLKTKIKQIQDTIPPSKEKCIDWYQYELHCDKFWNFSSYDLEQDIGALNLVEPIALEILEDHYCFMMIHSEKVLEKYRKLFPNAKVIQLYNHIKFTKIAAKLKGCYEQQSPTNPDLIGPDYVFEIDNNIFRWESFERELGLCLNWLGLKYSFDIRQKQYYNAYMSLHTNQ